MEKAKVDHIDEGAHIYICEQLNTNFRLCQLTVSQWVRGHRIICKINERKHLKLSAAEPAFN